MQRRTLLKRSLATALLGASPNLFAQTLAQNERQGWFGAQGDHKGAYGYGGLLHSDSSQNLVESIKGLSGFRGHGGAQHPLEKHRIFLFGRRPSTESIEIDLRSGQVVKRFKAQPNRHFFGHGAFSADGRYLFTTEADLVKNVGKIGIRDAHTFEFLGEYASHGIGPHQLMLMPDGKQLVIANGGILTRPETGRKKLNLDTMQSNLALVDINNGQLNALATVEEPKASIRHLDVAADGTIAFAMQLQREACNHDRLVPLAGKFHADSGVSLFQQPDRVLHQLHDYIGSVAINQSSNHVGFTSPKGDIAVFYDLESAEFAGYHQLQDVCGLVSQADSGEFVMTNSFGMVHSIDASSLQEHKDKRQLLANMAWDNHLVPIRS